MASIRHIIGIGGMGRNFINYMLTRDSDLRFSFVSQNDHDNIRLSGLLCVQDDYAEIGKGNYHSYTYDGLANAIDGADVLLVAGLGGKAGTDAIVELAGVLSTLPINVHCAVTLPFKFEGEEKMERAIHAMSFLQKFSRSIVTIKNQDIFLAGVDETTTFAEGFLAINMKLESIIESGAFDTPRNSNYKPPNNHHIGMVLIVLLAGLLCGQAQAALSGEYSMFSVFNEFCVQKAHDHEAIKATAKVLKWPRLSEDVLRAVRPDISEYQAGWKVMRGGEPFIMFLSKGGFDETHLKVCAVFSYNKSVPALRKLVRDSYKVEKQINDETPLVNFYKSLTYSEVGYPVMIEISNSKMLDNTTVSIQAFAE